MSSHKYKKGDFVFIRQWDDLVNEYGESNYGILIKTNKFVHLGIPHSMKNSCGKKIEIVDIHNNPEFIHKFSERCFWYDTITPSGDLCIWDEDCFEKSITSKKIFDLTELKIITL